jgi:RHS repeat-associated protein
MISKIIYPSGGYVRYAWGLNSQAEAITTTYSSSHWDCRYDYPAITDRYVSYDGNTEAIHQHFTYTTNWPNNTSLTWNTKSTTVTTTDSVRNTSFTTAYNYSPINAPHVPNGSNITAQVPVESTIQYNGTSGALLKTVTKGWVNVRMLASQQTTFPNNGPSSLTVYCYYGTEQEAEHHDYDFGTTTATLPACASGVPAGTVAGLHLRATVTNYASSTAMAAAHVIDEPASVIVYSDAAKTIRVAETDYTYDSPLGTVTSGVVQHSAGCNCGNLTSRSQWLNVGGSNPTTTFTNDDTGQRLTMTDPLGNQTTHSYADSYSSGTPPGPTNAFLTTVTYPPVNSVSHIEKFAYAYASGEVTSSTDQNNQVTTYKYVDNLGRLTETDYPDGGVTSLAYNDAAYNASTPSPSVTATKKINATTNLTAISAMNGLGQAVRSELTSDPSGTTYTDITRDGLGLVWKQSNPYRTTGDSTYGITTNYFDALGRTCLVVPPDGTLPSGGACPATQPSNTIFTTFSLNTATVVDQAGKSRKSVTDGLGRLTQVFEDPAGLNYETDYGYDTLGNLLCVGQKGTNSGSFTNCASIPSTWRARTFTYNSLSQLLTAANPESGTISYTYDSNGNLSTKTAPKPNQTGSLTVVTTDSYDAVNRLTQKSYNDGTTPTVKYGYDGVAPSGCTPPALTIGNPVGRRTSMCDGGGASAWSLNLTAGTGWKITEARTTNGVSKNTVYQNNLGGSVATLTNPSSRTITYTLQSSGTNTAGRMLSAIDTANSINYATAAAYAPTGALSSFTNGASLVETNYYDKRLQPCRISAKFSGTAPSSCSDSVNIGTVLDLTYNFNIGISDNGNVAGITNNRVGASGRSLLFTYDALNRIFTAKTTSTSGTSCWDEQFGYDPWANLLTIGRISGYTCSNEELLNVTASTKNQVSGYTYDAAGNLINDGLGHTYVFNAENQLICAASTTYLYDGDGKRVEKATGCTTPAASKLYWYGTGSDPLTESSASGTPSAEYVFFNGKRIARIDLPSAVVHYYFSDHLGSANVVTSSAGVIQDESDYYPFGGERAITNSDPNNYKFTGKERDSESGLDNFGARFDSSSMGRFMSPDPLGGRLINPQTLNKYSYVANNPINFTDPTGLYTCKDQADCKSKQDIAFEKARQQDLKSKDPNVVRAAQAYGDPTKDNGVGVQFGDPGKGKNGTTVNDVRVDPNDPSKVQASETVTIRSGLSGTSLAETVGHEGDHVADAQDFVKTIDIKSGGADQAKNLTEYATELKAYLVSNSILTSAGEKSNFGDCGLDPCTLGAGVSPARVLENINRLLADPKNYGVTPANPGPVLYPLLTTPK